MRDVRERLADIQEAIVRIEKYLSQGRAAFEKSELIQTWAIHHLEIIGEAVRGLPESYRESHPEVSWPKIVGMRNLLIHQYFQIDSDLVWAVFEKDLPALKVTIAKLLGEIRS